MAGILFPETFVNINISFDPVRLIGNACIAFLGGLAGNFLAAVIVAALTPSLDGGSLYAFAGLLMLAGSMFFFKAIVAVVVAAVATAVTSTARSATLWSLGAGLAVSFAFSLIMGLV